MSRITSTTEPSSVGAANPRSTREGAPVSASVTDRGAIRRRPAGRCAGDRAAAGRRSRPGRPPRWTSAAGFASLVRPSGPNRSTPSSIEARIVDGRVPLGLGRLETARAGRRPPRPWPCPRRARCAAPGRARSVRRPRSRPRPPSRAIGRASIDAECRSARSGAGHAIVHPPVPVHLAFMPAPGVVHRGSDSVPATTGPLGLRRRSWMRNRRNGLVAARAVAVLALVAAACSSDDDGGGTGRPGARAARRPKT